MIIRPRNWRGYKLYMTIQCAKAKRMGEDKGSPHSFYFLNMWINAVLQVIGVSALCRVSENGDKSIPVSFRSTKSAIN